jgi:hypothetical protein
METLGIKERGGSCLMQEDELEDLMHRLYTIIEHDCEANLMQESVRTSDDEEETIESPLTVCDKDFKVCIFIPNIITLQSPL